MVRGRELGIVNLHKLSLHRGDLRLVKKTLSDWGEREESEREGEGEGEGGRGRQERRS